MKKSKLPLSQNCIRYYILFGIIIALGTLLYLSLIGGRYIWTDEAYTLTLIKHNYSKICAITAADVHPPLYYILLKFCIQPFGYSLIAAKLFSIIPYILILIIGGVQLRKIFNSKIAISFMILFLLFPFSLLYAVEIRMYSLAALFVFINGIFAYQYYERNSKHDYWVWIISGVCASYTHYFALVSVGIIYLLLLSAICFRKKTLLKHWFIAVLVTFLLYLPWLGSFIKQLIYKVNNDYWISEIYFYTIREYAITMFSADGLKRFEAFAWCSYLLAFISVIFSRSKKLIALSICALSVPVGTIFIGVTVSLIVRPIFIIRYIIPSIPLLIVFMAIGLCQIRFHILSVIIWIIAFIGGISHYHTNLKIENQIVTSALDNAFVETYSYCDAYIVLTTPPIAVSWVLAYYTPDKPIYVNQEVTAADPCDNIAYIDELNTSVNENIVLIIDVGSEVPDNYLSQYKCQYLQEINAGGSLADTYLMMKK